MREVRIRSRGKGAWDESIDDLHDTTGTLDTSMIDLVNIDIETDENNVVTSARVVAEVEGVDVEIENESEATDEDVHDKYGPYLTLDQAGDTEPETERDWDEEQWTSADEDPERNAQYNSVYRGSAMHEILTIIADHTAPGDENGIRSSDIKALVTVGESTGVSAHTTRIYDRLLVERRMRPASTRPEYEYRITNSGLGELDRIGPFTSEYAVSEGEDKVETKKESKPQPARHNGVRYGTGYHEVLTLVADSGGNVTGHDFEDDVVILQPQSVPSSFSDLRDMGYVAKVGKKGSRFVYNLTDKGWDVLEHLGPHPDHEDSSIVPSWADGDEDE